MSFGCCLFWKKLEPVVRLELRVEASSSSSGFVELFVLHFVPGLVRRIGPFLELVPRGSDASTGRIGASSHQHVLRSAGVPGRIAAIGYSSLSLEPGSGQVEDHTRWRG